MKAFAAPLALVAILALLGANVYQWRTAAWSPDRVIADRFTEVWSTRPDTWFQNTFMGIQTWQNPFDVWVTFEIIWDVKPDAILETGTFKGGSALLWAMFLEHVNPDGRVVTIDLQPQAFDARRRKLAIERVDFHYGSSTDPEIVQKVYAQLAGKRVLAVLDSLHERNHVLAELEAYADLIPVGSYIIVQDGAVCGHPLDAEPCPGPYEAVEAFLAKDDRFEPVREHERHLMTANPKGFLRRMR